MFFLIYIVSIFGSKLLGFIQSKKSLSLIPKEIHIFLISGIITSAIAGFFYQQTSGEANTFNFLVSIFIIGSIYTALACFYWMGKLPTIFKYLFVIFVVSITVPRVIASSIENINLLGKQEGFEISYDELKGYEALNAQGIKKPDTSGRQQEI